MKKLLIVLGSLAAIVVIIVMSFIGIYNKLVTLNETVTAEWAQIDNQLQRRNDLIPNLVNTVKGYAKHEKEIFENVAEARSKIGSAKTVGEKIKANQEMDGVISRLLMIAENYPQLKANDNFVRLQDELAGTENRIAVARQRYNEVVKNYNVLVKRFPSSIVASFGKFEVKDAYFKAEAAAKEVPKVAF